MSGLDSRGPFDPDSRAAVVGLLVLAVPVAVLLLWALLSTPLPPSPSVPDHTGGDERAPYIDRSEP